MLRLISVEQIHAHSLFKGILRRKKKTWKASNIPLISNSVKVSECGISLMAQHRFNIQLMAIMVETDEEDAAQFMTSSKSYR